MLSTCRFHEKLSTVNTYLTIPLQFYGILDEGSFHLQINEKVVKVALLHEKWKIIMSVFCRLKQSLYCMYIAIAVLGKN